MTASAPGDGIAVGVVGAAGYAGAELCRLLLGHPGVGTIVPASRGDEPFERRHPNLSGCGLEFSRVEELLERAGELDVVFLSAPTGEALTLAPAFLDAGARVVDLSADFRFGDPADYERAHGKPHTCPELLAEAACGITELHRDAVRGARLVANPGCYAIAAALALAPLAGAGLLEPSAQIHLHAVNGTTGAGATPRREVMHAQAFGSMLAYNLEGHRHAPEIELRLAELGQEGARITLSTAHGSFARGIHLQAAVELAPGQALDREALIERYVDRYGAGHDGEHFVLVTQVRRTGALNDKQYDLYPSIRNVLGSNFCHIGLDVDARYGQAKLVSVVDNLVKGAAGSAIQNMNVMVGADETAGLGAYAL